jgi:hypothetical protein
LGKPKFDNVRDERVAQVRDLDHPLASFRVPGVRPGVLVPLLSP